MSRNPIAVAFCASAFLTISVSAQVRVRGTITGGPVDLSGLSVELTEAQKHMAEDRAYVNQMGGFELPNVKNGLYTIQVMSQHGEVLRSKMITVSPSLSDVNFTLPDRSSDGQPGGTVSVRQLRHKPVAKARKLFAAAQKSTESGDGAGAISKLRGAIEIDPEYMEAHNNLGCRLLAAGLAEEAVLSFQRAIDLDPRAPFGNANLAAALLYLRRPAEAEVAARRALESEGGTSKTRYLLGISLVHQRKYTREAAQSLRQAEQDFPNARLAAAAVLESLGDVQEARTELNTYLPYGSPQKQVEVKAWLSRLK